MACHSGSKEKPKICVEENSSKNRARIIFCLSVLNDLYYFVLDDSDKFYDGLLEKNIGNCCWKWRCGKDGGKEVEEKKLTPQQLRKKYFLKRMKREDK